MEDLRKELEELSFDLDITQQKFCSKEEEKELIKIGKDKFPSDIKTDINGDYFRYVRANLSENEIKELISYRQTKYLKSIKNSMLFFIVLSVVSILISLISVCCIYNIIK